MRYYRVRNRSDGTFLGKTPRFKHYPYFGREGKVYPGSEFHLKQALNDLRGMGYDVELVEYELVEKCVHTDF